MQRLSGSTKFGMVIFAGTVVERSITVRAEPALTSAVKPSNRGRMAPRQHLMQNEQQMPQAQVSVHVDADDCVHLQHPFEYAFYLNSHAGLQGTSRPTHYHVLADENRFPPNDLVQLTYK